MKMDLKRWLALMMVPMAAWAGPYAPAPGVAGSDAVAKDDVKLVGWAKRHSEVVYGSDVDMTWRTPEKAYGPATGQAMDIVCLGNGGSITLTFEHPIRDGAGADFAVFENSFSNGFLELAFVEVSSDGVHFVRFPSVSLTSSAVGPFATTMDPTNLSGLAGKYRAGFGTPFDLSNLPDDPLLDRENVLFVRIVDLVGGGSAKDSSGRPIYDPTPVIGSGGFDLEAVGVFHFQMNAAPVKMQLLAEGEVELEWRTIPGESYEVQVSEDLSQWLPEKVVAARSGRGSTIYRSLVGTRGKKFWRMVRLAE